jgi:thiamine transport system substrate-binding protein
LLSYASSPAAEVFYSKTPLLDASMLSLNLKGGVFQQVESVVLVKGGSQREAAGKFIEFLRSVAAQQALQTTMWMMPVEAGVAPADAMKFAPLPKTHYTPSAADIAAKNNAWVSQWTKVVLK